MSNPLEPSSNSVVTCPSCRFAFLATRSDTPSSAAQAADATQTRLPAPGSPAPAPPTDRATDEAAAPSFDHADLPPRIGRFELRRFLGEGSFGRVFEAFDSSLQRLVALKLAKPEQLADPQRVQRFQREARAAATLTHPHIVAVFDAGRDGLHHYIATTFIQGRSLEALLAQQPHGRALPLLQATHIVRKLAEALAYAHRCGVIHRDVKPANVLLDEHGEPLLADFGLALRDDDVRQTVKGEGLGTPAYIAPEQGRGEAVAASDQYSLGCLLFELLTGQLPFAGQNQGHYLFLHLHVPAPSPRKFLPSLPWDLETICLKCLEKDPAKRYPDCQELADDLRHWQEGEPITARPVGPLERAIRWVGRNPVVSGLAGVVAVVLLAPNGFSLKSGVERLTFSDDGIH